MVREDTSMTTMKKLPLTARELRHLTIFHLNMPETNLGTGLCLEYLLSLPTSLVELSIGCFNWFHALNWSGMETALGQPSIRFCGAHFPNLQSLRMYGARFTPSDQKFDFVWPPNLTRLEFPNLDAAPLQLNIASLPQSVTSLELGCSDLETAPTWLLRLKSLKTLKFPFLFYLPSTWASDCLPASLTHLDLHQLKQFDELDVDLSAALPRGLLHLDLGEALTVVYVDQLPPYLTTLKVRMEYMQLSTHPGHSPRHGKRSDSSCSGTLWSHLPRTLMELVIEAETLTEAAATTPPTEWLDHKPMFLLEEPIDASHLAQLPPHLRSLELRACWSQEMVSVLPRTLTNLKMVGELENSGPLHVLLAQPPASLTSLTIDHEFDILDGFMSHSDFVNQHLSQVLPNLRVVHLFSRPMFRVSDFLQPKYDSVDSALRQDRLEAVEALWSKFPESHVRPSRLSQYIRDGASQRCFEWAAQNWNIIYPPERYARTTPTPDEYHHWVAKYEADLDMLSFATRAFHLDLLSLNREGKTIADEAANASRVHILNWLKVATGLHLTESQQAVIDQANRNAEALRVRKVSQCPYARGFGILPPTAGTISPRNFSFGLPHTNNTNNCTFKLHPLPLGPNSQKASLPSHTFDKETRLF